MNQEQYLYLRKNNFKHMYINSNFIQQFDDFYKLDKAWQQIETFLNFYLSGFHPALTIWRKFFCFSFIFLKSSKVSGSGNPTVSGRWKQMAPANRHKMPFKQYDLQKMVVIDYYRFVSAPFSVLPSFESLIIWSKIAEEPRSKYCEESWDWLACSKTRGSQISGIDLRSVYPEDKIEWSTHQGITKSQVSLHIGCGNKSIYLQLLAILWKYTDLLPHPLSINQ